MENVSLLLIVSMLYGFVTAHYYSIVCIVVQGDIVQEGIVQILFRYCTASNRVLELFILEFKSGDSI